MRKKKKNLIKALVVAVIVGLAGFGGYEYKQNSNHTEELAAKEAELEANSQTVYVATADIAKGEKITAENVEMQPVYTGLDAYFYITADDIGSTAIVDIEAGVPVMYSMITDEEIANDTRDYEIAAVNLVTTQALNDVIDVRITFPDGSDYIVLSQKTIKDINLENCVFSTNLNEEEILRFTCADAGLRSQSVGAFGRIVAASAFFRAVYTCLRGFHIKNGIPAAPFHRPPGLSGSWIRSCRHGGEYAQRCRSECRRHLPHVFSDELTGISRQRICLESCSHSERKKGIRMIFIGCDGGSTKTEWLLCNERGRVLAHRTFSGCNCAFLGEDGFARLMADSAESLLADAGINAADVASAMFALTGYGEIPGTESSFPAALRAALPGCGQILIDNDSVAGWAGSLAAKPGINVVAGTGSVAYGRDPQRHGYRVGGWSLFFADEGSCSWVARQLITEFVKQSDGRRPRSAIYEEVRSALGITKDLYVSGYLQTEVRNNSALLAQLQPVALRAARRGDTSALDIYRRAAAELAETAVAIRCKLDFPVEVPVRVSYSGGLFHAGEIILQPFRKEMEQNGFTIEPPLYSPVIGATALAAERFISPAALDDLLANAAQAL